MPLNEDQIEGLMKLIGLTRFALIKQTHGFATSNEVADALVFAPKELQRIFVKLHNAELTGSPKRSFGESSDRRERG